MSFLKKPAPAVDRNGSPLPVSLGNWGQGLPALCEFLTLTVWDDGTARVPGSLTLFADEGGWKVCLSDKDQLRVAFVTASTPTEAFRAAETGLVQDDLHWRAQKPWGKKGKKD